MRQVGIRIEAATHDQGAVLEDSISYPSSVLCSYNGDYTTAVFVKDIDINEAFAFICCTGYV